MPLPQKQFSDFVNDQAAAMQAAANLIIDFTEGSIELAVIESNAGNALWIEGIITALLAVTRLQTSQGTDVDTFVQQFNLYRNPAIPALGAVTFSRFTATTQASISASTIGLNALQTAISNGTLDTSTLGALVYAPENGITYAVYPDTTNPNFNASLNAYILPVSTSSIDVPVIATTAGSIGNVLSNQINTISSVIVGVDTVINSQPFTDGEDQESDPALKTRFVLYISSLSKATLQALIAATLSVPGIKRYKAVENEDVLGNPFRGFFYFVIDDGTGNASGPLIANEQTVLDATRAFGVSFSVYSPTPLPVSITAHVFTDGSMPDDDVEAAVISAIETFISTQTFDTLFPYSEVPRIIYDTNITLSGNAYSPIKNVTNWTLQGSTSDLQLVGRQIMTPGTIAVTMNA